jgi:hypothetical protein
MIPHRTHLRHASGSSSLSTEPNQSTTGLTDYDLIDGLRDVMQLSARDACYVPMVPVVEGSPSTAHNVHALLLGAFSEIATRSAEISEFSNRPVLAFGATANEFTDKVRRLGPLVEAPRAPDVQYTLPRTRACTRILSRIAI